MIKFLLKGLGLLIPILLAGPVLVLLGSNTMSESWRTASRESAGIAPKPSDVSEAVVQVYAARAYSWRGAFGVHGWISVKPKNADHYTVYQVIGWRVQRGGSAVVVMQDLPDRDWFGSAPELLLHKQGAGVDALILKIDEAARSYPYADSYTLWPGPNSNSFIGWIARSVPELRLDLPPTAIGKDYLGPNTFVGKATSGTGYQLSLFGLLGVTAAVEEGLEINIAGLTFGIDFNDLNLKLPGFGRVGPKPDPYKS